MGKILTITIPAYNVSAYLNDVIPTFLSPSILENIEILIVNDGSKDNTLEIAQKFEKKFEKTIRVINKENGGHGSTINTGIRNATGKYFKVVDGDDWVDTDAFSRYVQKLEKCNSDMVLTPFMSIKDGTKTVIARTEYNDLSDGDEFGVEKIAQYSKEHKYAMHALTIKTSILKEIQPISEKCFYVDMEYIAFPLKYVNTVTYYNEFVYQYRIGNANQSMALKNLQKNRHMHLHVIDRLIEYYRKEVNGFAKEVLKWQICGLCEKHMIIICSLPITKENKNEMKEFMRKIRNQIPDLVKDIPGKKNQILLKYGTILYPVVASAYHGTIQKIIND